MTDGTAPDGRTRHYGTFYGVPDDLRNDHPDHPLDPAAPIVLIWGNCQAEALRVLLAGSPTLGLRTVRIPPVFELTRADLVHLQRLAERAAILLTQPVRDDYGNLPLGSAQVAAMLPNDGVALHWPVLRFAGFHPFQAIIRDPVDGSNEPPVVPYHDLRTLASAHLGRDLFTVEPSVAACTELTAASLAELQRREQAQCDIAVSDVFARPEPGDMFTINHPGNRVLVELARRIQRALGRPADATAPDRNLLGEVIAPSPAAALTALGVATTDADDDHWTVRGSKIPARDVHDAQLTWYAEHPAVVAAGWERHHATLHTLGVA
jgi:hypothetical protein